MSNSVDDLVLMVVDTYVRSESSDDWSGEGFKAFATKYLAEQVEAEEIDEADVLDILESMDAEDYYTDEYWDERRYIDTADVGIEECF